MAADLEQLEEGARARQRRNPVDHLPEQRRLRGLDLLAVLGRPLVVGERGDELVATHPDRAVRAPGGHGAAVLGERAMPGQRVLVVAVDERPVDVEDDCDRAHQLSTEVVWWGQPTGFDSGEPRWRR